MRGKGLWPQPFRICANTAPCLYHNTVNCLQYTAPNKTMYYYGSMYMNIHIYEYWLRLVAKILPLYMRNNYRKKIQYKLIFMS